jgi:hypothetical protein
MRKTARRPTVVIMSVRVRKALALGIAALGEGAAAGHASAALQARSGLEVSVAHIHRSDLNRDMYKPAAKQ